MKFHADTTTVENMLPKPMIWAIILICILPFILNQFGLDFSSPKSGIDLGEVIQNDTQRLVDVMHYKLAGSFTHTILEWSAFCTAIFVVILAFVHFRIIGDVATPVIGTALFCAGTMDAFHTLAADRLIEAVADNRNLIPFTWAISRMFNALIMIVGVGMFLFSGSDIRSKRGIGFIVGVSLIFGLIAYTIIHICATSEYLPNTMFPDSIITRPYDVAPLVLFVLAGFFVYLPFYRKAPSYFSHALLFSLIPEIATELHMAFGSTALFDNHFNIAHFIKIMAYLVPFAGLSMDYIHTYRMQGVTNLKLVTEAEERKQAVKALRESELKTRTIVEASVNGIILIDKRGIIELFNPSAERIFGYSAAEAIGRNVKMLMPPPYKEEHDGYLTNYLTTGKKKIIDIGREVEGKRKNGTTFPLYLAINEMVIDDEHKFVGMVTDITKRKEAERTLRESEEKFRSVTQSASDAIISADSYGKIVSWNRGAEEIFGYSEEEALNEHLAMLMPEFFRDDHEKGLARFRVTNNLKYAGKTIALGGLKKDGTEFPLELSLSKWSTGKGLFVTGIVRDVTERKNAEQALSERMRLAAMGRDIGVILTHQSKVENILQLCTEVLVKHLDVAFARIWIFNKEENVLDLKASAGIYTHLDGDHGRLPLEANLKIPHIARERKSHSTNSVVGDPQVDNQEWAKREGMVSFAGNPLIVGDELVGVIAMFSRKKLTEITLNALSTISGEIAIGIDRKNKEDALLVAKEKAEESNRLKSDFLNTMSHELRTPLTVMLGNLPLLTDRNDLPEPDEIEEISKDIEKSGKHLLTLINDLLDLSKIEAGKMEIYYQPLSVVSLVKEVVDAMRVLANNKGIEIETEVEETTIVNGDFMRLKQILLNLLSNAVKFTDRGKVELKAVHSNGDIKFQVIDTGAGIAETELPHIFDSFRQVDSSTTRSAGGTGLGLAITKKLVELHGGQIWVESRKGEGSVFEFNIPVSPDKSKD